MAGTRVTMSDQGAVNELLAEGGALGADDAERLERHLVLSPDDFATRTRLLGYYIGRQKKLPTEPPSEDGILSARSMRAFRC